MNLPRARLASVKRAKLTGYLLNPAHPDNGGKAAFFLSLGFRQEAWETLAAALQKLALTSPVTKVLESAHGRKSILDAGLVTPFGKRAAVRTIWIIDRGREIPRLVTAYPIKPTQRP